MSEYKEQFLESDLYLSGFIKGETVSEDEFSYVEYTFELEDISIRVTKELNLHDELTKEYCEMVMDGSMCKTAIRINGVHSVDGLEQLINLINE